MASILFKLAPAAFCFSFLLFTYWQLPASDDASTSSDCKMGACTTQVDDATVMIQSSAKVSLDGQRSKENAMLLTKFAGMGDLLQVGGTERLAAAQQMESSMELAVKKMINGTGIALPIEIFESLESSVEQMAGEIFGEKDNFQTQINNANAEVALCNTHMKTTENSTVATAKATADADKITHRTCRQTESTAYDDKTLSCNANADLTLVVANAAPDCNCPPGPQGTPAVLTCLALNRNWVESNEDNLQAHLSDCNTKTATWSNKANDCDADQSQYEASVCSYDLKLENMCSALDTCYNDKIEARAAKEGMVNVEEQHLKAIFASAKKIVCFLSVLKKANNETITMNDFDSCKNMDVLTDKTYLSNSVPDLTIAYPPADAKESCQSLNSTPGEAQWEAAEYADFTKEWLREIAMCQHKIAATTTAVSLNGCSALEWEGAGCSGYVDATHDYLDRSYTQEECAAACSGLTWCKAFFLHRTTGTCYPVSLGCTKNVGDTVWDYYLMTSC